MTIKTGVILAGGLGTRLRPITYEIPKALIPIHGRTMTEHLFDLFKKYGVTNIFMAVGHMRDKIMAHYRDGSSFGIHLDYIEETEPLGTAGPLRVGKNKLRETFFCSNGDELKKINLTEMEQLHRKHNALVTIALFQVDDPSMYGVARLHGDQILEFVEKPKKGDAPSNSINSGFYIIEPEVLDMIPPGFSMLEKDIFPKLAKEGKLFGYQFKGQWFDTGSMERYERAIREWIDIE